MNMLSNHAIFISICILTAIATCAFAIAVKGIYFYGHKTDNQLIINAAACAEQWGTLSGMHKFAHAKAHMKEFAVFALAFMQRLLRDTHSDYPLVVLCSISNAVSAVLIYAIAAHFWGIGVALLLFFIFTFSFWPPLIALWGGVVAVAQAVALGAIYCLQLAEAGSLINRLAWYSGAGVMLALVIFSSASSRKYLPLIAAAFFWSLRGEFFGHHEEGISTSVWIIVVVVGALTMGTVLFKMLNRQLMERIYTNRAGNLLNSLIKNHSRSLDEYMGIMDRITETLTKIIFLITAYLLINVLLTQSDMYWSAHVALLTGFCCTVFIFVFPNIKQALSGFYIYSQYGKPLWRSRFYGYRDFFSSIRHPIPEDMRGAGWLWVLRYLYLMIPVPLCLYMLGIGLMVYDHIFLFHFDQAMTVLIVILLSLSPVLMAEASKAVQVGRSYFPAFLGILFLIGFSFYSVVPGLEPVTGKAFWSAAWILVAGSLIVNMVIFYTDILPGRLAVNRLVGILNKHGIKKFYTYDTAYNEVFIHCIPQEVKKNFDIHFLKSIKEVNESYVVVPPLNAKGSLMSDFPLARHASNIFKQDIDLDAMIESKSIESKAIACLPSMSSSRIWVHEAEVPSYRDLILKEITPMDFYRGKAWVLKV